MVAFPLVLLSFFFLFAGAPSAQFCCRSELDKHPRCLIQVIRTIPAATDSPASHEAHTRWTHNVLCLHSRWNCHLLGLKIVSADGRSPSHRRIRATSAVAQKRKDDFPVLWRNLRRFGRQQSAGKWKKWHSVNAWGSRNIL